MSLSIHNQISATALRRLGEVGQQIEDTGADIKRTDGRAMITAPTQDRTAQLERLTDEANAAAAALDLSRAVLSNTLSAFGISLSLGEERSATRFEMTATVAEVTETPDAKAVEIPNGEPNVVDVPMRPATPPAEIPDTITIYDAATDQALGKFADDGNGGLMFDIGGAGIAASDFTLAVTPQDEIVDAVRFELFDGSGTRISRQTENVVPYALFGDIRSDFDGFSELTLGAFSLEITYLDAGNDVVGTETIDFSLVDSTTS